MGVKSAPPLPSSATCRAPCRGLWILSSGDTRAGRVEAKWPCTREAAPQCPSVARAGTVTAASAHPGALGGDGPEARRPADCHGGLLGLEGICFLLGSSGQTTHFLFKEGRETRATSNPILRAGMRLGRLLPSNPTSSRFSLRAVSLAILHHLFSLIL